MILTGILVVGAALLPARAQQAAGAAGAAAGAVQQSDQTTRQYERLLQQLSRAQRKAAPAVTDQSAIAAAAAAHQGGPSFLLHRVVTNPSAVLTPAQIDSVTAPYVNHRVTIGDLQQMVLNINQLYLRRGFLTARAVLPPQRVVNGVVRLQLVEARVDRILVQGARHTHPDFIRRRIGLAPGSLVDLPSLRHYLLLLNAANDLHVRALLRPGQRFGTTDVVLQVHDPGEPELLPTYDNLGRGSVGLRRIGEEFFDPSLLGYRDQLRLSLAWATGTWSESGSYSVPIGTAGTRFILAGDYGAIHIISGSLHSLNVTGSSYDMEVGLVQPLLVREGMELSEAAVFHVMRSDTQSGGFGISDQIVHSADLSLYLRSIDSQGVWIASNTFTFGSLVHHYPAFGRESLSLAREEILGHGFSGIFRFTGQARLPGFTTSLPLLEQFQLGGLATLRGYPQGWEIGDTGYAMTTELDYPLPLRQYFFGGAFSRGLRGALFVDHGGMFGLPGPHTGPHAQPRDLYMTSAGLGIIFNSPWLTGRLDWAAPLENRVGLPKVGFDFYLQPHPGWAWWHWLGTDW